MFAAQELVALVGWRTPARCFFRASVQTSGKWRMSPILVRKSNLLMMTFLIIRSTPKPWRYPMVLHKATALTIRDAKAADFDTITRIYAHYVLHALATFEEIPPDADEMRRRHASITGAGLPYLVAEMGGVVVGYSYATAYRPRSAYRHTIEDSIYIADGFGGRDLGLALLTALIERCDAGPWRELVAVIGSVNAGSIALHARLGFDHVGVLRKVGYKHGQWVDTVLMQRSLGEDKALVPQK
ncbi:GCN5-related N-acetyltransferase [Candidatus Burkholderia crenata]|nr:GCN5-related N-acetyltransferase [Candidatus Burkholderia crenata]